MDFHTKSTNLSTFKRRSTFDFDHLGLKYFKRAMPHPVIMLRLSLSPVFPGERQRRKGFFFIDCVGEELATQEVSSSKLVGVR